MMRIGMKMTGRSNFDKGLGLFLGDHSMTASSSASGLISREASESSEIANCITSHHSYIKDGMTSLPEQGALITPEQGPVNANHQHAPHPTSPSPPS